MRTLNRVTQYTSNTLINLLGTFSLADGSFVDPSGLVVKIQPPTGSPIDLSNQIIRLSTGKYTAPYLPTIVGTYQYEWIATGNIEVAVVDQFDVNPAIF